MEQSETGRVAATDGWFAVNVRDAAWVQNEYFGDACIFESRKTAFPEIGYTLYVLQPGQPNGMYHREGNQEDFLVLQGECLLLVEGQERPLKQWDFVHCPPWTEHVFVGAGEGPCTILAFGGRAHTEIVYPVNELAARHGASVPETTNTPEVAYADLPPDQPVPFQEAWLPG